MHSPAPTLLRRGTALDRIIVTDRAVIAITSRPGASRAAAEDAALDLADFHPACRNLPVIPILLRPSGTPIRPQFPLPLAGAAPVVEATPETLPALLAQIARFPALDVTPPPFDPRAYAPTPGLLDAACLLYANHGDARLRLATATPDAIRRTQSAIRAALNAKSEKTIVFVTGTPGAGKTLCGLDLAFAPGTRAAYLTGNPTLVHILRDALVRDAADRGLDPRAARRRVDAVIGALPRFRDAYASPSPNPSPNLPPESLLIIDEAQRCWTAAHAIHATRKSPTSLTDSEPAHLLAIMERHPGPAAIVCLLGGGQEIYDGEGGLAAWGEALARHPAWTIHAPTPETPTSPTPDPRRSLPATLPITRSPDLHLATPLRSIRAPDTAAWVDALLADDPIRAATLAAQSNIPFRLTRSLADLRTALRQRGTRTSALIASSTARRLRAEGLGAILPHQDDAAISHFVLSRWPDIRSSDALEVVATEFAVQGLEFDRVGLCWDADLIRTNATWTTRRFRATTWTRASPAAHRNRLNAYRVLLTRARHGTIIWIPRGDSRDPTRDPAQYDAIAAYLTHCGVPSLDQQGAALHPEGDKSPSPLIPRCPEDDCPLAGFGAEPRDWTRASDPTTMRR